MPKSFGRVHLVSSAAVIALVAGSTLAIAQMETAAATDAPADANPLVQAALAVAPAPVAEADAAVSADGVFRKITVPAKGLYRFEAPVGSGIKLSINGQLVIDASGAPVEDGGLITALQSLTPGDHAIEITGVAADAPELSGLTFSSIGSEPRPLMDASLSITPGEAATLAVANTALSPSATAPAVPQARCPAWRPARAKRRLPSVARPRNPAEQALWAPPLLAARWPKAAWAAGCALSMAAAAHAWPQPLRPRQRLAPHPAAAR